MFPLSLILRNAPTSHRQPNELYVLWCVYQGGKNQAAVGCGSSEKTNITTFNLCFLQFCCLYVSFFHEGENRNLGDVTRKLVVMMMVMILMMMMMIMMMMMMMMR